MQRPSKQLLQTPREQTSFFLQRLSHWPQLATSEMTLTHWSLHAESPVGHEDMQRPALQVTVPATDDAQTLPQPPQLFVSPL